MVTQNSVFLVDDDKFLLETYQKKFAQSGYKTEMSLGSEDALRKLRDGLNPELLILDIIMPSMDGLELLATIRKENLSPDSTVIMLTNETDREKIEKAKSLGIKGYIVKATSLPSEVVEEALKIAKGGNGKNFSTAS